VLILLDLQNGILDHLKDAKTDYVNRVSVAIKASRAAGIPIIFIKTCFRRGHPEVSKRNATFGKLATFGGAFEGEPSTEIATEVAPLEGEIVVSNRRVSAFAGSDLDCLLRALNVESLILAGVATSGAVLSTVRQAADLDFKVTVLGDLCADGDPEVHRVLVEKIFPRQGTVLKAEEWIKEIGNKN